MPTQRTQFPFSKQALGGRKVVAAFDGGAVSSNAGALLLRQAAEAGKFFDQVAACFQDHRDPSRVEHSVRTLVSQRITGIALGHEDVADHDQLRHDPVLALLAEKRGPRRKGCAVLAGKATLNRLENGQSAGAPGRYHKITADLEALSNLLVDRFMERATTRRARRRRAARPRRRRPSRRKPPSRIVLDIDPTDVEMHGAQEGRRWHGYYGHHCCLPLYVVCGRHTLGVALRAGNAGPLEGAVDELERIVSRIRARWPGTEFVVRADAGYGKDELMSWCEARGVHYILGLAKNERLVEAVGWELADAEAECEAKGRAARRYVDFEYATRKTWSKKRRVVGKAEWLPGKANPRFVATSLPRSMVRARALYEHLYCGRGRMENVIKEQQLDLFGERLSASAMAANQLRLIFSALAGALIEQLREALHNTRLARATAATLRAQLLKIGARVLVSVRRVKVAMDSNHPRHHEFALAYTRLQT